MNKAKEKKMQISPIIDGTALDHLMPGTALKIIEILKPLEFKASIALNVESKRMKAKDIVFISGKELSKDELEKISLLAKDGTLNIIRDSKVVRKETIKYPEFANSILKCINPNCISNKEAIGSKFRIISSEPLKARCFYCESRMNGKEIADSII